MSQTKGETVGLVQCGASSISKLCSLWLFMAVLTAGQALVQNAHGRKMRKAGGMAATLYTCGMVATAPGSL